MRAVLITQFGVVPTIAEVAPPSAAAGGVVLRVEASGLCRSDWHAWQGHDSDVSLPHVPGHELAGVIAEVGSGVHGWRVGERVVVPFICACGRCEQCRAGQHQVCTEQQQPGFNYWGSFAEYVAVPNAEVNLVRLPDELDFDTAAGLGCRFATAHRAVTAVADVRPGEWVTVFGCGGVGLSATMIAAATGARVIAVDVNPAALELAAEHGASHTLLAGDTVVERIRELTGGGTQVSIDAIGSQSVVQSALLALRPRGRHVQLGLLVEPLTLDLSVLAFRELAWLGSHGMAAHSYPAMLELVRSGAVRPDRLVTTRIGLGSAPAALAAMSTGSPTGITVIRPGG